MKKKSKYFELNPFHSGTVLNELKPRSVPQINGLRVENFIIFIKTETDNGINFLPVNYKDVSLNSQWIANLCKFLSLITVGNTFDEDKFKIIINSKR